MPDAYDTPSTATADTNEVHIDGPGGAVVSMTPAAAKATAEAILAAAAAAKEPPRD